MYGIGMSSSAAITGFVPGAIVAIALSCSLPPVTAIERDVVVARPSLARAGQRVQAGGAAAAARRPQRAGHQSMAKSAPAPGCGDVVSQGGEALVPPRAQIGHPRDGLV